MTSESSVLPPPVHHETATASAVLGATVTPPPAEPIDADRKGTPFDPDRHLAIKHPKTGCWMPRRKPSATAAATPPPVAPGVSAPPPRAAPAPDLSDIEQAANRGAPGDIAGMPSGNATMEAAIGIIQMLFMLAGEEEGLFTDVEKMMIRESGQRILAKYQIGSDAIPCEFEFFMLLAVMFIERVKRGKKTATFFAKAKAWVVGLFFKAKGAQAGAQMRREAPTDLVDSLNCEVAKLREALAAQQAAKAPGGVA